MENYVYIERKSRIYARLTRERASFEPYPLLIRKVTKIICCTNIPKDTIHLFIRFDRKLPIFRFIIQNCKIYRKSRKNFIRTILYELLTIQKIHSFERIENKLSIFRIAKIIKSKENQVYPGIFELHSNHIHQLFVIKEDYRLYLYILYRLYFGNLSNCQNYILYSNIQKI